MQPYPISRSWSGQTPFTVAAVPTGMNAGVRKAPRSVAISPVRAAVLSSFAPIVNLRVMLRSVRGVSSRVSQGAPPPQSIPASQSDTGHRDTGHHDTGQPRELLCEKYVRKNFRYRRRRFRGTDFDSEGDILRFIDKGMKGKNVLRQQGKSVPRPEPTHPEPPPQTPCTIHRENFSTMRVPRTRLPLYRKLFFTPGVGCFSYVLGGGRSSPAGGGHLPLRPLSVNRRVSPSKNAPRKRLP